jgi:hypothetical protein
MSQDNLNAIQHCLLMQKRMTVSASGDISGNVPHYSRNMALIIAGVIAFGPLANAAMPSGLEVFRDLQEVPDGELQHMRGKFAGNNQVLYFGVEMVSRWQTELGTTVTAGANLDIDFQAGGNGKPLVSYVPTVSVVQQGQSATQMQNGGTNSVSGGAGLGNVSGVSQSIQVAGRSNRILNGIDMQVNLASSNHDGGSISGAVGAHAGTVSANGDDGTLATVSLGSNSIGLEIVVPGQGEVLQQIRDQGMFQSARIGGDLNQIHNAITMHIGINAGAGNAAGSAYSALQSLRDLQQKGVF